MSNIAPSVIDSLMKQLPGYTFVRIVSKNADEASLVVSKDNEESVYVIPKMNISSYFSGRSLDYVTDDNVNISDVILGFTKANSMELIQDIDFYAPGALSFQDRETLSVELKALSDSPLIKGRIDINVVNKTSIVFDGGDVTLGTDKIQMMAVLMLQLVELEAPPKEGAPLTPSMISGMISNLRSRNVMVSKNTETLFKSAAITNVGKDPVSDVAFFTLDKDVFGFRFKVKD